jgi:hypothetical protein
VEPLRVFVYNRFWLRFANLAFDLTDLDIYEKESREKLSRHRGLTFYRRFGNEKNIINKNENNSNVVPSVG